jgi:hypothetical protein
MTVTAPPTRRPALTRLDEELLARLLQQAQTPIEAYTRESALGVPWGSLANSLVGGMLAGRERRRQEEKIKRQDDYADAVTRITSMGTELMPGQVSISPQGTFETLPTDVEGGGVSTFTRPDILQSQQQINTLRNDPEMMERLRSRGVEVPMVGSEFEATTEAPLGIPYAPQAATLTVGEEFPEDSNELTRFLSGKEEPVTLDQNANVALTQALRGAGYEPLEYMQYMRNKDKVDISYGKPFTLYGDDGSENIIMSKSDNLGNVQYINSFDQKPFIQKPKVKYSLNKEEIDTTKPYKISFTDGSESVTKSGYVKNGKTYIQWNGKETLVTDIPNVANVEPTSLAKGNTFNIGGKPSKWQEVRASKTAEKWTNWDNAAYQAQGDINLIDTAMTLIAQENTPSGMSANLVVNFKRALKTLNPNLEIPEAANAETLVALLNEGILGDVKRLTGPISEKELKFLSQIQASLGGTKEGNAAILLYKKMLARKQANWNSYIESKGGEPENYKDANNMFREYSNQFTQKYGEGAQGFFNFAKTEAEIEVAKLKQELDDEKINLDQYKKRAFYIVNNKYQLPYLKNNLGF